MAKVYEIPLARAASALLIRPCGDDKWGVYLTAFDGSYLGAHGPATKESCEWWKERFLAQLESVAKVGPPAE